jgi:hypothetical protein
MLVAVIFVTAVKIGVLVVFKFVAAAMFAVLDEVR